MTIERQYGKIIFICDSGTSPRCDEQIETGESEFADALRKARREGWGVTKVAGEWMHYCFKCERPT